jgi:hypothetical protein
MFRLPPVDRIQRLVALHELIFQWIDIIGEVIQLRGEVGNNVM